MTATKPKTPATPNHVAVKSSQIKTVGYDAATKTLEIRFNSGGLYRYADVPAGVHADLMKAKSIGKHFGANVRGKFAHTLVKEQPK